jgi:hypothetical protein
MRRWLVVMTLAAAACAGGDANDTSSDWVGVLGRKKAAVARSATPRQKQIYADSLQAFVMRYPGHGRAREVYRRVQLDFAQELAAFGRYQDAIRFYRAVLGDDPHNAAALHGLAEALDRLVVSRQKLLALEKGMSQTEVARVLGKPIPGWSVRTERADCVIESWYYRTKDRGVAGVYFRDGELFAAEEKSNLKVVPLVPAGER